jgi:hypothetical protein
MSDSSGHRRDETAPVEKPWKKDTRNVPPLVWLVIVAAIVVVGIMIYSGTRAAAPSAASAPAAAADAAAPPSGSGA